MLEEYSLVNKTLARVRMNAIKLIEYHPGIDLVDIEKNLIVKREKLKIQLGHENKALRCRNILETVNKLLGD